MKQPFCFAPWLGISLRQDGSWKPCGAYSGSLGKIDESNALEKQSLLDLKKNLLDYQPPKECSVCLLEEASGRKSKRLKITDHVKRKKLFESDAEMDSNQLRHLELAFSNRCNFTCAMCSGEYSSSWRELTKKTERERGVSFEKEIEDFQLSDSQVESLLDQSKHIKSLQVLGGEPLYEKQFYRFLKRLAKINPDCDVCVATNGSLLSESFIENLNEFRSGSLDLSIDGTHQIYEYVRGFSFERLEKKLELLSKLKRGILVSVFFSPSLYNFYDLPRFLVWGRNLELKYSHLKFCFRFDQIVGSPEELSCLLAPLKWRREVSEKIEKQMMENGWDNQDLKHFIRYLNQSLPENRVLVQKAIGKIQFFNEIRKLDLWEMVPEMRDWKNSTLPRLQADFVHQ